METKMNMNVLNYIVKDINLSVARLGINTQLAVVEKKDYKGESYLAIESTSFQTMPMIFKRINLIGGIGVQDKGDDENIIVAVRLNYKYQTFYDGSNGHQLGQFKFEIAKHCWDKWDGKDETWAKFEIRKVQGLSI